MKISDLREKLNLALVRSGSGKEFSDFSPETGLDELFIRLKIIYQNEYNQFLRAELAEHEIKKILFREANEWFRDDPSNSSGQGDIEFLWKEKWYPISIKYKGPDNRKEPRAPTRSTTLSALQWRTKKEKGEKIEATCPMLIIWDANRATSGQTTPFNFQKGICIVDHEEFNKSLNKLGLGKGNQPYAFQLKIIEDIMCSKQSENIWIRPLNREVEIPSNYWEYSWNVRIIKKKNKNLKFCPFD